MIRLLPASAAVALISGCAPAPEGLAPTPDGNGPLVVVDWDAEPLPELPFPNDLATRTDPNSPTGLMVNIPTEATTLSEQETREKVNHQLSGFGIYSAISASFEWRLDLADILSRHADDYDFSDDAVYVINVDPSSPDYLQPVYLDVGHGRFPVDVPRTDRYFVNDARAESPSLMFETYDEDLNGNGVLDWGEDTDNDGILDVPNVWPEGGDPRDDLMGWYELQSDTLILRPVVPLQEQSRYAVVITDRLTDADGAPVQSPWPYVNHVRQTEALLPVLDALPEWGLGVENVAFAWTFSTGRVTADLVDLRRGLDGEGPFSDLGEEYPAGIYEALRLHELGGDFDDYELPVSVMMPILSGLGFFSGAGGEFINDQYTTYGDRVVGGAFDTPYLLVDRDDDGRDDSDEHWQLNPVTGEYIAAAQRVPFTCVIPKPHNGFEPPYDVALFGHGYGSSRFDMFGFAHAFNRMGVAVCTMDFPGHGPTVPEDDLEEIVPVLEGVGLMPFLEHLQDSRQRDLNNDGVAQSGGDQWSADTLHTRDMVRQAALDWMQMIRSLKACGGEGAMDRGGEATTSCDWDLDGVADLGGPDAEFYVVGGSLGGYNSAVLAAVEPSVEAFAPIVAGGGVLDNGVRTEISGAVEALLGRLMSPLIVGIPTEAGGLQITQVVNSVTDMVEVPIATLDSVPAGGKIRVENLMNGEIREGWIPEDGAFRVGIAADALDAAEKRLYAGIPEEGPEDGAVYELTDNDGLGDPLEVTIWDAAGNEVAFIDAFESEQLFEGVTARAGSPLVALSEGTGRLRGSTDLRRVGSFFASVLEPGDPIAYAPRYFQRPYEELGGEPARVLLVPTPGDMIVSVNAQIALARAAGFVDYVNVDDRYGVTVDQWLIDRKVVHGLEEFGPYTDINGEPALFDADDLDNGMDRTGAPSDAPLRMELETERGTSGVRIPYVSTTGSHGFGLPDPEAAFDINTFAIYQIAHWMRTGEISDDRCLADGSCDFLPQPE